MPLSFMWCTRVVISRAPLPPSGWPSAIAPPLGFSVFASAPMSASQASGTDANASFTSKAPISSRPSPLLTRAFFVAGMGAVSMITGSSAASTAVCIRAMGVSPSSAAFSLVVISSAALPSLIWELLPAWITPSSLNAGLSLAIVSSVPPRRTPSSVSTTVPSSRVTGVICPVNRPSSMAAAAFSCEPRENSSSWARDKPQRSAIISAPIPWFGGTPLYSVASAEPDGFAPPAPIDEPIGTRLIDSTPPATTTSYWPLTRPAAAKCTDCWLDPHCRSTVTPGTLSGQPAASTALRAMSNVCSPNWLTQPQITSSTTAGSVPERSASARSTCADRSTGCTPDRAPFRFPTGVRTAATITASRTARPPYPVGTNQPTSLCRLLTAYHAWARLPSSAASRLEPGRERSPMPVQFQTAQCYRGDVPTPREVPHGTRRSPGPPVWPATDWPAARGAHRVRRPEDRTRRARRAPGHRPAGDHRRAAGGRQDPGQPARGRAGRAA